MPSDDTDREDPSPRTWDDLTPFPPTAHGPMEPDSWTDYPDDDDRYQGHRRASGTSGRRWLIAGLAGLALIAVGASLLWHGRLDDATPPLTIDTTTADSATAETPVTPTAQPTATPPTATTEATAKPTFTPLTIEAEAGPPRVTLIGSARVTPYDGASGGRIVTNIGNREDGAPGALRINDVTVPYSGRYQLAIYYANAESPGSRTAIITGAGPQPITLTFTGGRKCCGLRTAVVMLTAGTYSITIGNPDNVGPSIDKVIISAA